MDKYERKNKCLVKNEMQIQIHTTAVRSISSGCTGARTGASVQGSGVLTGGITYYKLNIFLILMIRLLFLFQTCITPASVKKYYSDVLFAIACKRCR